MRRLADAREHLDGALSDRRVLEGNLRDLRRINRVFGGAALSVRAVRALVAQSSSSGQAHSSGQSSSSGRATDVACRPGVLRVLDVGCGAADIPVALLGAKGPWRTIEVTAVDNRREVVDAARALTPAFATTPNLTLAVADGLALPYPDRSFDVAHASLLLHHLEPESAVRLLLEMRRVAGIGVVVNDLSRSRVAWLGALLLVHVMTSNRFTRHDGPLSVLRAYTVVEAAGLVERAGMRVVHLDRALIGQRWALAAVQR